MFERFDECDESTLARLLEQYRSIAKDLRARKVEGLEGLASQAWEAGGLGVRQAAK